MFPELELFLTRRSGALAAGALVLYLVISYIAAWYRLRHFKGPLLASFSYLWMFRGAISGRQSQVYKDTNKKYGILARIGPNDLITDDPDLIRRMSGARSTYGRSSWYYAMKMDPYDDCLISMSDAAAHDKLKAKMSFAYGGKENPALEGDIDEQLGSLNDLIRRKYLSANDKLNPMDLAQVTQFFTLDVITRIAYGKEFGYMSTDTDMYGYTETVLEQLPFLVVLSEIPILGRIFLSPIMLKLLGPKKTDKKGIGKMLAVAEKTVAARFGPDAIDQMDMIGAFVRRGVTQRQCESEMLFQIVAGSDTTATVIRGTMLYLMSSRHEYDRLQKEIDAAIAEGRISSPIRADEGRQLEYLQAVIYEGMRMQIPFSGLLMKQVPPGGDTVNGMFIPGGTRIGHNVLGVQRSTAIFGDDVEIFRPERWLGILTEKRTQMVNTVELVFGYGRWGCAGKPVAFIELNKVYVELLRYFDFQLINPMRPWTEVNHNVFFHKDMFVKVTERTDTK